MHIFIRKGIQDFLLEKKLYNSSQKRDGHGECSILSFKGILKWMHNDQNYDFHFFKFCQGLVDMKTIVWKLCQCQLSKHYCNGIQCMLNILDFI